VFEQTRFSRLATHFNISMFCHQTILDGVWLPNIFRLYSALRLVGGNGGKEGGQLKIKFDSTGQAKKKRERY